MFCLRLLVLSSAVCFCTCILSTSNNEYLGQRRLTVYPQPIDHNKYVDVLLEEMSKQFIMRGNGFNLPHDFGHFEAEVNGSFFLVDYLLSIGVMKGLSQLKRASDVNVTMDKNSIIFTFYGNISQAEVANNYTLRFEEFELDGNIETIVSAREIEVQMVFNYEFLDYVSFATEFPFFEIVDGIVSGIEDFTEFARNIEDLVVNLLYTEQEFIHQPVHICFENALRAIGLPPRR